MKIFFHLYLFYVVRSIYIQTINHKILYNLNCVKTASPHLTQNYKFIDRKITIQTEIFIQVHRTI